MTDFTGHTDFIAIALKAAIRADKQGCPSVSSAFLRLAGSLSAGGRHCPEFVLPERDEVLSRGIERLKHWEREVAR